MEKIDIILWVLSGGFGLILVMWHFLSNHMEKQDAKIEGLEKNFHHHMEKQEAKMEGLEKNFHHHMEKQEAKMEGMEKSLHHRMDKQEARMEGMEKNLQQINTRVAVIESKLTDISNNVSHLMWHHQALPQKEVEEQ